MTTTTTTSSPPFTWEPPARGDTSTLSVWAARGKKEDWYLLHTLNGAYHSAHDLVHLVDARRPVAPALSIANMEGSVVFYWDELQCGFTEYGGCWWYSVLRALWERVHPTMVGPPAGPLLNSRGVYILDTRTEYNWDDLQRELDDEAQ